MITTRLRFLAPGILLLATVAVPTAPASEPAPDVTSKPAASYRLDLELSPMAAFPFLKRFGNVDLSVFPGGVRADGAMLDAISRTGAPHVTVANPVARMYADVPLAEIRSILVKLGGGTGEVFPGLPEFPIHKDVVSGKVRGIDAKRYRVMLGPDSWIDVWSTHVVPKNRQFDALATQAVSAMSRPAANVLRKIPGTPVYVELNTGRFKKVVLLRMKTLQRSAQGEADALKLGAFYARAPIIGKLLE